MANVYPEYLETGSEDGAGIGVPPGTCPTVVIFTGCGYFSAGIIFLQSRSATAPPKGKTSYGGIFDELLLSRQRGASAPGVPMRILIIGSGGREHALAWKLKQSPGVDEIFVAPGNGGTASLAQNQPVSDGDVPALVAFAREHGVDFVVPGPELPLTLGVVDAMNAAGIPCFGPSAACARLEGSKAFAKEVMKAAGVPTAAYGVFSDKDAAKQFAVTHGAPLVIKADGLAAGKGVVIAMTEKEADEALDEMFSGRFGSAGETVVLEEFLRGEEVSLLCFCDGETALPLPSAQDHKAAYDGDQGPNTGGMGAYSPAPVLPDADLEKMADITVRPILREMARRGTPFRGILYAGLMMTAEGPRVLEYNVRFGDPECQPLLMRLDEDLFDLLRACVDGTLAQRHTLRIRPEAALGVVVAAKGYPGSYARGMSISGIEEAESSASVQVFQAGTRREGDRLLSSGGRVLCVTALGCDLADARDRAYAALKHISMPDSFYRHDIGLKGLKRLQEKN